MPENFYSRSKSPGFVAVVAVLAVAVWGLYAWRASRSAEVAVATHHENDDGELGMPVTPLRSTRPIGDIIKKIENETPAKPTVPPGPTQTIAPDPLIAEVAGSTVRANAAPSDQPAGEMHIVAEPTPATPAQESASTLLAAARAAMTRGEVIDARGKLTSALSGELQEREQDFVRTELTRLADALLFSRATNMDDPLVSVHVIGPGDTLHALAAQHRVTDELLARINRVTEPNHLRIGQNIKLLHGPFRAVITKATHRMDVYLGGVLVRSFKAGLGANGYTPTGEWVVNNKLANPDWTDPHTNRHYLADDPDNPIGERWIGLQGIEGEAVGKTGFGIHGTIDPNSIGSDKSMGCVRLSADDVSFLYDLLVLNHSKIIIK